MLAWAVDCVVSHAAHGGWGPVRDDTTQQNRLFLSLTSHGFIVELAHRPRTERAGLPST
jgi:hypothetical protein